MLNNKSQRGQYENTNKKGNKMKEDRIQDVQIRVSQKLLNHLEEIQEMSDQLRRGRPTRKSIIESAVLDYLDKMEAEITFHKATKGK